MNLNVFCFVGAVVLCLNLNSNGSGCRVTAATSSHNFTFIYRDYLRNMVDIMDREVEPCADFFQHACGRFENYQNGEITVLGSEEEATAKREKDVEPFLYNMQDYYQFFETHKDDFTTMPGMLVQHVYDQCKNFHRKTTSRRHIWQRMISDISFLQHDRDLLRKWPFLQYQWKKYESQFDLNWAALAAEFAAHGLDTFLKVFFAENTIYVAPNDGLQCPQLKDFTTSLLPLLRQRNAQQADIIANELWLLCRQLKGEIAVSVEIENIENLLNDEILGEFFQHLFSRLNFTDVQIESARKTIIYIDKLSEIMSLLRSTNPRIVFNFILWQSYQQIASTDDCFQLVNEFSSLVQAEYWYWHVFDRHFGRDVALATFLFHATRFQKHYRQFVTSSSWERLFQSRAERKDLNIERSIKNYAKQYLDLENYANIFQVQFQRREKFPFYAQLLELRRLKLRYSFYYPYEDSSDLQVFNEFLNFCILLLYRPRFHFFASYGREMWQNSNILHSSDGLYAAVDCLNHQTELNGEDSALYETLSMEQVNNIFVFYVAFMEALFDYKFWLESENFAIAEDFILEYFQLNSKRVLFYAVAQQFCNRNDAVFSSVINRSYMNMLQFQEAFECGPEDEMNPIVKCMANKCQSS